MKKILTILLLFVFLKSTAAQEHEVCSNWPSWMQSSCRRLHQIWTEGANDLYLSGYSWHNRYTYPKRKIRKYNELAWGGGIGKGLYDENGNWQGLYALAFLDSHKKIEPAVGYGFIKLFHLSENARIGPGFTILATARSDIFHGIPFVGVLPGISASYRQASIQALYIPGKSGVGNVLFVFGKWTFDKSL